MTRLHRTTIYAGPPNVHPRPRPSCCNRSRSKRVSLVTAYKVSERDRSLIEEFGRNPLAHQSKDLQRLLNRFHGEPVDSQVRLGMHKAPQGVDDRPTKRPGSACEDFQIQTIYEPQPGGMGGLQALVGAANELEIGMRVAVPAKRQF